MANLTSSRQSDQISQTDQTLQNSLKQPPQADQLQQPAQEQQPAMAPQPDQEPQSAPAPQPAREQQPAQPQPSVTVIMPVYNVEPFLRAAMDCVCAQTLADAEFICVNDGSMDGSLAILQEYAVRDPRIRVLDGPNGGYGKAMNRGIDAARGKYIGIYEPDDYIPANMFADLYETAEKYEAEVVKADYYTFRTLPDGSMRKKRVSLTSEKSYYNRVLCPGKEQKVFFFGMFTWTGVYRRDFLNRHQIRHHETPGASFQDNGFWFRTLCLADRAVFSDQAYYHYRQDNPNSSINSRSKMYCMSEEYRLILEWLEKDPQLYERYKQVFYARKFNAFIRTYRRRAIGHRREYLRHIAEEFREPLVQGLLSEKCMMNRTQWIQLNEITADPDAYFEHICVSVIVPVYNAADTLREMLDSLLCSWELQYEVICIDAGSSDGSLEILREYEADERVRVYTLPEALSAAGADSSSGKCTAADGDTDESADADSATDKFVAANANTGENKSADSVSDERDAANTNVGIAAVKNLGIRLSAGEYLLFLDPDCQVEPELIRRLHENAHTNLTDITVCRSDFIFGRNSDKAGHGIGAGCAGPNNNGTNLGTAAPGDTLHADSAAASSETPHTNSAASAADAPAVPKALSLAISNGGAGVLLRTDFVRGNHLQFAGSQAADELRFLLSAFDLATKTSVINDVLIHRTASPEGPASAAESFCKGPASVHTTPSAFYAEPAAFYTDPACFRLILDLQQQALQREKDLQVQAEQLLEIHRTDTGELKRLEKAIEKSITAYQKSENDIRLLTNEKQQLTNEKQQLSEKIQKLSSTNQDLQQKLLSTEAAKQKTEAALTRTRQSRSYRIGRAITYLPRKIRALLHRSAATKK